MGIWTKPQDTVGATPALSPPSRPERFDLVVVGDEFSDWLPVLAPTSGVWRHVPQVGSVALQHDGWPGDGDPATRLVLPLLEHNIRAAPAGWALLPPRLALDIFADKGRFAAFVADYGLDAFAPQTYEPTDVRFPCVLKRTDLCASHGVRLVRTADELDVCLGRAPWAGHAVVIQEYVESAHQLTVHAIAADGILVWHAAYEVDVPAAAPIRVPRSGEVLRRETLSAPDLFALQQFIAPLAYSGPLNVDLVRRPGGKMAVLEINPRLGGSLFKPFARAELEAALRLVVQHSRWHESGTAETRQAA